MERKDSHLSSSTKIIRIRGLNRENLRKGSTHPFPSVDVLQKMPPVDEGKGRTLNKNVRKGVAS